MQTQTCWTGCPTLRRRTTQTNCWCWTWWMTHQSLHHRWRSGKLTICSPNYMSGAWKAYQEWRVWHAHMCGGMVWIWGLKRKYSLVSHVEKTGSLQPAPLGEAQVVLHHMQLSVDAYIWQWSMFQRRRVQSVPITEWNTACDIHSISPSIKPSIEQPGQKSSANFKDGKKRMKGDTLETRLARFLFNYT